MFVSPCTLRSAQCAALIALATVAGIARVETNHLTQRARAASEPTTQTRHATRPTLHFLNYSNNPTPAWTSPWLQPVATVALWFFSSNATTPADCPADLALPSAAPTELPCPAIATSAAAPPATSLPALCTRDHLIPFAVGPPASTAHFTHRAVGTSVPADVTVRCPVVFSINSPLVPSLSCSVARLACPVFSGPSSAGRFFSPSSALRGEPAPFPALLLPRPSLGASARPGPDPLTRTHLT